MNLIKELQNEILDSNSDLSSILRKAKVLASQLRAEEMKKWVDSELNGYANAQDIPDYRRSRAENVGDFMGPFGYELRNAPIPTLNLPDFIKAFADELRIPDGIRTLENYAKEDGDSFRADWPTDLLALVSKKIYKNATCITAWQRISKGRIVHILDTVRNRLLDFLLELQEKYPEIANSEDAISKVPKEQAAAVFHNYIYGSHNIVASGTQFTQTVHQSVEPNDIEGLSQYMKSIGISTQDINELKKAIEADGPPEEPQKLGSKVAGWIGRMTGKIAEGTWKVAMEAGPKLITEAILRYYGSGS